MAGDANEDGRVDVADLGILAANYGRSDQGTWSQGDFNCDGRIDVADLGILAANYGTGTEQTLDFASDAERMGLLGREKEGDEDKSLSVPSLSGCGPAGLLVIAGMLFMSGYRQD